MSSRRQILVALALLACVPTTRAQDEWERTMLLYMLAAGIDGESQVGSTATDIDQSFSDLVENLHMGAMGSFRASKGDWAHTVDAIYIDLRGDATLPSGGRMVAELGQLIASYDLGYKLGEHFEVLGGVRFNSIDADVAVSTPSGTRQGSDKKEWVDPYIGATSRFTLTDALVLAVRADVGGFDVGSKLAWQAVVRLDWQLGETFFVSGGYRILDMDYEDGSGADYFKYDIAMSGPGLGVGWRFR